MIQMRNEFPMQEEECRVANTQARSDRQLRENTRITSQTGGRATRVEESREKEWEAGRTGRSEGNHGKREELGGIG